MFLRRVFTAAATAALPSRFLTAAEPAALPSTLLTAGTTAARPSTLLTAAATAARPSTFLAAAATAALPSALLTAAATVVFPYPVLSQGAPFQTPAMPSYPTASQQPGGDASQQPGGDAGQQPGGDASQTSRFSSVFNPAFSFVIDATADYADVDEGPDGFDTELRTLELAANSWVDPDAWAYFAAAANEEELDVEEAAVHYIGLGSRTTIRAGRFFVDFGKQMQVHIHELRTVDRPLVLRTYLGDEIKGDGVQFDQWYPVGDEAAIRWSIGAFSSLLPEESPDFLPVSEEVADRKSIGDMNYTARLTGFADVGERGIFQVGSSARFLPDYSFLYDPSGATAEDLSSTVVGLDATYGFADETGAKHWTFGGEYLFDAGDNGAEILDSGTPADPSDDTIDVLDPSVGGYYVFADYAWSRFNSVGVQYSALELPDADESDESEIEAYWTHNFSEFHRLRLAVSSFESDLPDEDALRCTLQYTATLGAHGHGVNW